LQDATFAQVIKRGDWSAAMVDSLKSGKVTPATLGPANIYRLRNHSDKEVARRASAVMEELRGPEAKEKAALLAQLEPEVSRPGDAAAGKAVYTQNCSVCHKYGAEGRDVGPELTGMGAHGVHELLVHILDPNRFVEENYIAVSIETKDEQRSTASSCAKIDPPSPCATTLANSKSKPATSKAAAAPAAH
jgi:hypothetical protein